MLPKRTFMTLKFKTAYLDAIRKRYYNGSKKEKSAILDELCNVTGFHRKHAIRILARGHKKGKKASGRTKVYSDECITHLKKLWHIMGRICSKKMVSALPTWLDHYQAVGFNNHIKADLTSMSHATLDRYLKSYKAQFARQKRTGTVRAKRFSNIIPIKDIQTKTNGAGFLQADTVAHCGNSLSGTFIWSLTVTDEYSGWTVNRASYGKHATSVVAAIMSSLWDYPFDIKQFNTDSGTEFINSKLQDYLDTKKIAFTRSRPYRKNDNCYVEQKNFTHVREIFGYERFDKEELVYMMNDIYKNYFNLLSNFFIPQLKTTEVSRVGAKYVRKYDKAKTPYERLMSSNDLSIYQKEQLREKFESLNPIQLRRDLNDQMKRFKRFVDGKSDFRYKYSA